MVEARTEEPWPIRIMIAPLQRGMFIRLPIVDTDPNRGVTFGFMPIWVLQEMGGERIQHIFAPSVSYNKTFKEIPTLRYYGYPTKDSDVVLRGSVSRITDREVYGEFHDRRFMGRAVELGLKVQYNVDGAKRFFGIGPDSSKYAESNYVEDVIQYRILAGLPFWDHPQWMLKASHHLAGYKIADGPINAIPDINSAFPGQAPFHRHQNSTFRLMLDFDSRDSDVTTRTGRYAGFFFETSQRPWGSEYAYQQYGVDLRQFYRLPNRPRHGLAANLRLQQVAGDAPFWLLPQLGGKYVHRAYGEGRYIDRGLLTSSLEHRYTFYEAKTAGVTTEFEVAPFTGLGVAFDHLGRMASRYARPVYGAAVRAVARPQVVGSIDFGVGQEGMTAFMDINYAF